LDKTPTDRHRCSNKELINRHSKDLPLYCSSTLCLKSRFTTVPEGTLGHTKTCRLARYRYPRTHRSLRLKPSSNPNKAFPFRRCYAPSFHLFKQSCLIHTYRLYIKTPSHCYILASPFIWPRYNSNKQQSHSLTPVLHLTPLFLFRHNRIGIHLVSTTRW